jgi:hypothetical protein
MATPIVAERFPSQDLAGVTFGQAKAAFEKQFLEERTAHKGARSDGAVKKQKLSLVSSGPSRYNSMYLIAIRRLVCLRPI